MEILKVLGKNIRTFRKGKELSQEQLAEKASLHITHISRIERGLQNPSIDVVERIAAALDTESFILLAPNEAALFKEVISSPENQHLFNIFKELDNQKRQFILNTVSKINNYLFLSDIQYFDLKNKTTSKGDKSKKEEAIKEIKHKARVNISLMLDRFNISQLKIMEELLLEFHKIT